ncbi:MAG: cohesin domain-containing protein [Euryarchaeota archaeon]|nr:cohesin domain-containing protein [Euryarchaeota archaeon]
MTAKGIWKAFLVILALCVILLVASPSIAGACSTGVNCSCSDDAAFGAALSAGMPAYSNVSEMLTYTNAEYNFSIGYPHDWTVQENLLDTEVIFSGPIEDDYTINANVITVELPNDTINGKPVSVHIIRTTTDEGIEVKHMQACFVRNTTAYVIGFTAASSTFDTAEADYFVPMLQSFKFIEEVAGIEISITNQPEVLEGGNFTAIVTVDNSTKISIFLFKLNYDPSVIDLINVENLINIEKGSDSASSSSSSWVSWGDKEKGTVQIIAYSDPLGTLVNGSAELVRLEFHAVGPAGEQSALDIQGIIGNSAMESIETIWVDSEVTVTPENRSEMG